MLNSNHLSLVQDIFDNMQMQQPEEFFKIVFLKIPHNSQENTCVGVSFSYIIARVTQDTIQKIKD